MTRLPTVFVSHGSPMFALEPGLAGPQLAELGFAHVDIVISLTHTDHHYQDIIAALGSIDAAEEGFARYWLDWLTVEALVADGKPDAARCWPPPAARSGCASGGSRRTRPRRLRRWRQHPQKNRVGKAWIGCLAWFLH